MEHRSRAGTHQEDCTRAAFHDGLPGRLHYFPDWAAGPIEHFVYRDRLPLP
jgi:hypothetical protein